MGRGGGGSSGRSSGGGGGSRSSGGSHGGSSFSSHRGGYGSSRPSSSYHSSPSYHPHGPSHRPPPPPPGPRHVYHHHYGYGGTRYVERSTAGSIISSLLVLAFFFILIIAITTGIANSSDSGGSSSITRSTIAREKLEAKYVTTTDWYTDNAGWISNQSKLVDGMRYFYKETGVQPYLYITETIDGVAHPSDSQMEAFADKLYDELFEDEGHLLVVFQEYGSDSNYFCWTVAGKMAKTVFDNEARDIFFDYIDHFYYSDLDEEAFFSTSFEKTADRMMTVTKSPLPKIIISVVILIGLIVAFAWWKKAKEQKNIEDENTERILKAATSNQNYEDPELSKLESKYSDD